MEQPRVPGFVIRRLLGRGSSGAVWLAVREHDHHELAIKVVDASGADAADAAARARREWAVLSRVDNPHLVRLHSAVALDDRTVALVLDLADGGSLGALVAGRGHLSPGETVTVLAPVARAVADLHAAGVVHADLSPGNVLLTSQGRPMLGDLGVARIVGERPGHVYATAGYVAPEVSAGAVPGPEADVYSLGALAWFCLTGAAPPPSAIRPPLGAVAGGLPPALVRVVTGALDADPSRRPAADRLAVDLFDATPAQPVRLAQGSDPAAGLTHRIRAAAAEEAQEPARRARRPALPAWLTARGAAVAALGALALAGLGVGGWWLVRPPGSAPASAPVPRPAPTPSRTAAVSSAPTSAPASARPVTTAAPAGPGLRAAADAVSRAPLALVQELADLRAAVYTARDVAALKALDAPGSAALAADTRLIGELRSRGLTYVGLRYVAHDVRVLGRQDSGASVRVSVDTAAYATRAADGRTAQVPARAGSPVTLTLRWTSSGWRIERIA